MYIVIHTVYARRSSYTISFPTFRGIRFSASVYIYLLLLLGFFILPIHDSERERGKWEASEKDTKRENTRTRVLMDVVSYYYSRLARRSFPHVPKLPVSEIQRIRIHIIIIHAHQNCIGIISLWLITTIIIGLVRDVRPPRQPTGVTHRDTKRYHSLKLCSHKVHKIICNL